jgi:hypothetical protein
MNYRDTKLNLHLELHVTNAKLNLHSQTDLPEWFGKLEKALVDFLKSHLYSDFLEKRY